MVIGGCALVGADPYLDVLLKVNTPGVVGIIALLALTSAAVVAYFVARRHTVRATGAPSRCAALATVLLTVVLVVLVANIDLLTNADTGHQRAAGRPGARGVRRGPARRGLAAPQPARRCYARHRRRARRGRPAPGHRRREERPMSAADLIVHRRPVHTLDPARPARPGGGHRATG